MCNTSVIQLGSFGLPCPCAHHHYLERSPYALHSKPAQHLSYLALGMDTCKLYFTCSVTKKHSAILVTVTCIGLKSVPFCNEETGHVSQSKTGNEKDNLPDVYNMGTAVFGSTQCCPEPLLQQQPRADALWRVQSAFPASNHLQLRGFLSQD